MKKYTRTLMRQVEKDLFQGKTMIIYGPRQVGKTTLVEDIIRAHGGKYYTGDIGSDRDIITSGDVNTYKKYFQGEKIIVIDEAQKIANIGSYLKIIHDHIPEIQVIATGSSSFDIAHQISEPLTGRVYEYTLFPLSVAEVIDDSRILLGNSWHFWLQYGMYPDIIDQDPAEAERRLKTLASNYLYRDVLQYGGIKKPELLDTLLRLLALQIGNEVSYHELAQKLGIGTQTVQTYISLLEKSFVIFTLRGYSRNLRKEITKSPKIYFYDLGVRNALINQMQGVEYRADIGHLWENFCVLERLKYLRYHQKMHTMYFWRTYDGQEVDIVEDTNGIVTAWECKWGQHTKAKIPPAFARAYPDAHWSVVTPQNIDDGFIQLSQTS